jgi:hypothetical protein
MEDAELRCRVLQGQAKEEETGNRWAGQCIENHVALLVATRRRLEIFSDQQQATTLLREPGSLNGHIRQKSDIKAALGVSPESDLSTLFLQSEQVENVKIRRTEEFSNVMDLEFDAQFSTDEERMVFAISQRDRLAKIFGIPADCIEIEGVKSDLHQKNVMEPSICEEKVLQENSVLKSEIEKLAKAAATEVGNQVKNVMMIKQQYDDLQEACATKDQEVSTIQKQKEDAEKRVLLQTTILYGELENLQSHLEDVIVQTESEEKNISRAKTQKNLFRLKRRCLVNCYDLWSRNTEESIAVKTKTARIVDRVRNSLLVNGYEAWSKIAIEQRSMKITMHRTVCRRKRRCLVNCYDLWSRNTEESIAVKTKTARIVDRVRNSCIVNGYEAFRDNLQKQIVKLSKSEKIGNRLKITCLLNGYKLWRHIAREQIAMQKKLLSFVVRLLHSCLVKFYNLWSSNTQESIAAKIKTLCIVHRLKNRCLVKVLELWRDKTAEEKLMRTKARKVGQRLMSGALVLAWWREHVIEEKQMRAKALKVVQELMNGALVSAFERWRDHIIEEKQMESKARKVVHRIMNDTLVQVFELWSCNTQERIAVKAKSVRIIYRSKRNLLWSVMQTWRQVCMRPTLFAAVIQYVKIFEEEMNIHQKIFEQETKQKRANQIETFTKVSNELSAVLEELADFLHSSKNAFTSLLDQFRSFLLVIEIELIESLHHKHVKQMETLTKKIESLQQEMQVHLNQSSEMVLQECQQVVAMQMRHRQEVEALLERDSAVGKRILWLEKEVELGRNKCADQAILIESLLNETKLLQQLHKETAEALTESEGKN